MRKGELHIQSFIVPIVIGVLCFVCALIGGFSAPKGVSAECSSGELTDFLAQEHFVGETITLPQAAIAEGGNTYETDVALVTPGGDVYVSEQVTLGDMGEYTLLYTAKNSEITTRYRKNFTVAQHLFTSSGDSSSTEFGSVLDIAGYNANGRSGLVMDIAQGETVYCNSVIDLNNFTGNDTFLQLSFLPHTLGTADAQYIYIVLTDAYDSNNTVTIELRHSTDGGSTPYLRTFAMFYAEGQGAQGLESNNGSFIYEGKGYTRHLGDMYGAKAGVSMQGAKSYSGGPVLDADYCGTVDVIVRFDYDARRIYYGDNAQLGVNLGIDLDDANLVSTLWNGFTTGECYLSFSAGSYNSQACRLLMSEVAGKSTEENETIKDEQGPEIVVEDAELKQVEYAVIGNPFVLPEAEAYDGYSGKCPVDVHVYTAYDTSTQAFVAIEDGAFIPLQKREYTVVYSATDYAGNTTEKIYRISAQERTAELQLQFEQPEATYPVGQLIDFGIFKAENANGNYHITVNCEFEDQSQTLAELSSNSSYRVTYRPMHYGTYKFIIEYGDYTNSYTQEITVEVTKEGEEILPDEVEPLRYIVRNAQYKLPEIQGYKFIDGVGVETPATLYITQTADYSAASPVTDEFIAVTEDWSECYLTYVLGAAVEQYKVPVIDVGFGTDSFHIYKYFSGFTAADVEQRSVTYTVGQQDDQYRLDFINTLMMYNFGLNFTIPSDASYTSVTVSLSDKNDKNTALNITLSLQADGTALLSYNGTEQITGSPFYGGSFSLAYNELSSGISIDGGENSFTVINNSDGSAWEGFVSEHAWMSITFSGSQTAPEITISRVNNQTIGYLMASGNAQDSVSPQISNPVSVGYKSIGETITLEAFYAGDVLDPNTKVSMNVMLNDKYITSADGITLQNITDTAREYIIELTEYGTYMVNYSVTDSNGNSSSYSYAINVVELEAPAVTIGSYTDSGRVNERIKVATISVTDNVSASENCTVRVYVCSPQNLFTEILENYFIPETAGTYSVWYFVTDEAENSTFVHYDVTVS